MADETNNGADTQTGTDTAVAPSTQNTISGGQGGDAVQAPPPPPPPPPASDSTTAPAEANNSVAGGAGVDAIAVEVRGIISGAEKIAEEVVAKVEEVAGEVVQVVERKAEGFMLFAQQHLQYTGESRKEAWQLFCQAFGGMMRWISHEPDMNLLTTEQQNQLEARISR